MYLFCSILFYSILILILILILVYSILFYSILFYSILFYFILTSMRTALYTFHIHFHLLNGLQAASPPPAQPAQRLWPAGLATSLRDGKGRSKGSAGTGLAANVQILQLMMSGFWTILDHVRPRRTGELAIDTERTSSVDMAIHSGLI